jgi:hypothetical protein
VERARELGYREALKRKGIEVDSKVRDKSKQLIEIIDKM